MIRMRAATAGWYDEKLTNPAARALAPLETSPWRKLYLRAAGMIGPEEPVIDLGCGTGRFAHALYSEGREATYLGVDFSRVAIDEARRSTAARLNGRTGLVRFELQDLREWQPPAGLTDPVFTCLEVLEHLDDDQDLIRRIPPGHRVVISVPNFHSESHVRWFRNRRQIAARYAELEFRRWAIIPVSAKRGKRIHLADAVRVGGPSG